MAGLWFCTACINIIVLQFSIDVWVGAVVKYKLLCASTCGCALVFVFFSIFEIKK